MEAAVQACSAFAQLAGKGVQARQTSKPRSASAGAAGLPAQDHPAQEGHVQDGQDGQDRDANVAIQVQVGRLSIHAVSKPLFCSSLLRKDVNTRVEAFRRANGSLLINICPSAAPHEPAGPTATAATVQQGWLVAAEQVSSGGEVTPQEVRALWHTEQVSSRSSMLRPWYRSVTN